MDEPARSPRKGERRLPMALAVLTAAGLYLLIPPAFRITEVAVVAYPAFLVALVIVLVAGDPGRIDRDRRWLRVVTALMIAVITVVTAVSALRLVMAILLGADFDSPSQLLTIGAIVWVTNVIAFSLWYWALDSGGPVARAGRSNRVRAAFCFPEENIPELVDSGWYARYVDYLALSFNTATAFSPTDVSAIRHWSKLCLMTESVISLVLVALVVARAINVL